MNRDHERYASWDAAYALGALSGAERAEFEEHLAGCALCREAVAEVGPTVSLLSRLSAADAEQAGEVIDSGPVRVLAAAREKRRARRRLVVWASGIAAAVVVATVVSVSLLAPRPPGALAMQPVDGAPVTASVAVTTVPWGTKLDIVCEYDGYQAAGAKGQYVLAVVSTDGTTTMLSTWNVVPGATARLSAGTALPESDIRSIEIRDASGTAVVRHALG